MYIQSRPFERPCTQTTKNKLTQKVSLFFYLARLGARCESALAETCFEPVPLRPSRKILLATLATFALVFLDPAIMLSLLTSNPLLSLELLLLYRKFLLSTILCYPVG